MRKISFALLFFLSVIASAQYDVVTLTWNGKQISDNNRQRTDSSYVFQAGTFIPDSIRLKSALMLVSFYPKKEVAKTHSDTIFKYKQNGTTLYLIKDSIEQTKRNFQTEEFLSAVEASSEESTESHSEEQVTEAVVVSETEEQRLKCLLKEREKWQQKVPKVEYFWKGEKKGANNFSVAIVTPIKGDPNLVEEQKEFLLNVLKTATFKKFDAIKYYNENQIQTEENVFLAAKSIFEAAINGDTLSYYQRIANVNDFEFILQKAIEVDPSQVKELPSVYEKFKRNFTETYSRFARLSEMQKLKGNKLENFNYIFSVKTKTKHFSYYSVNIAIPIAGKKINLIFFRSPRGFVLVSKPKWQKVNIRKNAGSSMNLDLYEHRVKNGHFINKPLSKYMNEFANHIANWAINNKTAVINHRDGQQSFITLNKKPKNPSIKHFKNIEIDKIKTKKGEISKKLEIKNSSPNLNNELSFIEEIVDNCFRKKPKWIHSNYIDSTEFTLLKNKSLDSTFYRKAWKKGYARVLYKKSRTAREIYRSEFAINRNLNQMGLDTGGVYFQLKQQNHFSGLNLANYYVCSTTAFIRFEIEGYQKIHNNSPFKLAYDIDIKARSSSKDVVNWEFNGAATSKIVNVLFKDYFDDVFYSENSNDSKEDLGREITWKYNYKGNKLVSISLLTKKTKAQTTPNRIIVYLKDVPKHFYNNSEYFKKLSDLFNAKVTVVEEY